MSDILGADTGVGAVGGAVGGGGGGGGGGGDVADVAVGAVEFVGGVVGNVLGGVLSGVAGVLQEAADAQALADRLWNDVLRANRGGHHRAGTFTTDFEAVPTLAALRAMIENADPAAVQTVADHWQHLHDELTDTAAQLTTHADNLLEHWNGPSAGAFRRQVQALHTELTEGAAHAANAAAATGSVAHALTVARAEMPADPGLFDSLLRAFTSQRSDAQFKTDAAKQGLARAVAADGAQLSAQEQARQQAVVVMERLGVAYNDATARLDRHTVTAARAGGTHGVWLGAPGAARASLLGHGGLRAAEGGIAAGALVGGPAPGGASTPNPAVWLGPPPPGVSASASASATKPSRAGAVGEEEPVVGSAEAAGAGVRPAGVSGGSGSGRRSRTRYPQVADDDAWDAQPAANPPVIEA